MLSTTTRYFYDGVNEIVETDGGGDKLRYYIHGISYVDERLMMMDYKDTGESDDDRPYYYTIDRMYNVRFLVDRAGALVERYMYDAYGRPHIRESCGRGDMDNETTLTSTDSTRFTDAKNATIWDPRADMDDDGDVDANDQTAYDTKVGVWPPPTFGGLTVKQAFSDAGNPFMFQGRPHFALDTGASATVGKLMINDHRARMNDPVTGRWITRDPLLYNSVLLVSDNPANQIGAAKALILQRHALDDPDVQEYLVLRSNPVAASDPTGLCIRCAVTGAESANMTASVCIPLGVEQCSEHYDNLRDELRATFASEYPGGCSHHCTSHAEDQSALCQEVIITANGVPGPYTQCQLVIGDISTMSELCIITADVSRSCKCPIDSNLDSL